MANKQFNNLKLGKETEQIIKQNSNDMYLARLKGK
jgi:hypothetical protein